MFNSIKKKDPKETEKKTLGKEMTIMRMSKWKDLVERS